MIYDVKRIKSSSICFPGQELDVNSKNTGSPRADSASIIINIASDGLTVIDKALNRQIKQGYRLKG